MRPGRFHPGNTRQTFGARPPRRRFNEAGAFPPRKCGDGRAPLCVYRYHASMRPGRFHPGNVRACWISCSVSHASMRPGRFHPGNHCPTGHPGTASIGFNEAGAFPPRKSLPEYREQLFAEASFNEAGAFPPRKFQGKRLAQQGQEGASMRPGRFHPGNACCPWLALIRRSCFNEAGAFPPRKSLFLVSVP